jgi:hypothetical protein
MIGMHVDTGCTREGMPRPECPQATQAAQTETLRQRRLASLPLASFVPLCLLHPSRVIFEMGWNFDVGRTASRMKKSFQHCCGSVRAQPRTAAGNQQQASQHVSFCDTLTAICL